MTPPHGAREPEVKGWRVETCQGFQGCPNRAVADDTLAGEVGEHLARRRMRELLEERVGGPLKHRQEFVVVIADCPNACSRPQIADVGIIGAAEPQITLEACHQCMGCVKTCRERAVVHPGLLPIIDPAVCVRCGQCARDCVSGTIQVGRRGWRVQVGGKLGRRPRLGIELPGIFDRAGVLAILDCALDHYLTHDRGAERFGAVLDRTGIATLAACVGERAVSVAISAPRSVAPILRGPV